MTVYEALMLCTAISTLVYFMAKKEDNVRKTWLSPIMAKAEVFSYAIIHKFLFLIVKKSDSPEHHKLEGVVTFPGELHFK
ncbi:hypothetical protein HNR44_003038 [Geomicrobium halophilum]|uniref:Uncharacterized protein n=1 Tax=Geomicrobium halophilum TaxID=549000 RepID=A0A841PTE4_9BACL|nr:hypothetical protein [Geomicrobium halophilum]MBB6451044.1 hypothetical protein [Geomicrobium halophilum]